MLRDYVNQSDINWLEKEFSLLSTMIVGGSFILLFELGITGEFLSVVNAVKIGYSVAC